MNQMVLWSAIFTTGLVSFSRAGLVVVLQGLSPGGFVPVGNAGNACDTTGYGAVAYEYCIGRYEVTIADWEPFYEGRKTNGVQGGLSAAYNYWNNGGSEDQKNGPAAPVTHVSLGAAAQYCNWLTTGSATHGAYTINSTGGVDSVNRAFRNPQGILYVLPTENEWYKAAYYTGRGYSMYANGTATVPVQNTDANYGYMDGISKAFSVGSFAREQNGTFNMMGNVAELLEDAPGFTRGGCYNNSAPYISAAKRLDLASLSSGQSGFRVVRLDSNLAVKDHWIGHSFYRPFDWQKAVDASAMDSELASCFVSITNLAASYLAADTNIVVRGEDDPDGEVIKRFVSRTPVIALAAIYTQNAGYFDYVNRQLAETATWDPLERAGLQGGAWLYTAWAIQALIETMDIMGDSLDGEVRNSVTALLQNEVDGIVEDYHDRRQWFFKPRGVYTPDRYLSNQYIILVSGLGLASLYLGGETNYDAYALSVEMLNRSVSGMGHDGSCFEGFGYAQMANASLFRTLLAFQDAGENRFVGQPALEEYPNWVSHLLMPGFNVVNYADCAAYKINPGYPPGSDLMWNALLLRDHGRLNWLRSLFYGGRIGKSPVALRCLYENLTGGFDTDRISPEEKFAYFSDSGVLVWRSDWDPDTATGLWIKGGSRWELHNHRDNGQISLYRAGTPILIDVGVDGYSHPLYTNYFRGCAGHNVLQAEGKTTSDGQIVAVDMPLSVTLLTETSGRVEMQGSGAYTNVTSWIRSVSWTNSASGEFRMEISDSAQLLAPKASGDEWFRFHTGAVSSNDLAVLESSGQWTVAFANTDAVMEFTADKPITVDVREFDDGATAHKRHACILIQCEEASSTLMLNTRLVLDSSIEESNIFAQTSVLSPEPVLLFTEISADGWTADGVRIFKEEISSLNGSGVLRVECDFSKKEMASGSKAISSDLLRPGEHGALEFWSNSPDLFSIEVGLTRMQNGREAFYSCVVVSAAQSGAELELTSELLFPRLAKILPNQKPEMK